MAIGRVPLSNIFEFGTAVVLVGVRAILVFALRPRVPRGLGLLVFGPVVLDLVLIGLYLFAESGR